MAGENWGSLDRGLLARVFHYLKADSGSIQSSASTCKSWYNAALLYKSMCKLMDLSSAGTKCNDMEGHNGIYIISFTFSHDTQNAQTPQTCKTGNDFILLDSVL